jgi:protein-tyrosine kinase
MSRIHEALKKAELERATVGVEVAPPQPVPPITPVPKERNLSPVAETDGSMHTNVGAPVSQDPPEFEELWAHSSHPRWSPDLNVSVFNPALGLRGAEQFRTLRSKLYQLRGDQQLRILLVTSSVQGEGKTFVASNLAQAIVHQPDRRVLVIDADLRCSRLHVPLGAPSSPGLTDYLRGDADEKSVIQSGPEGHLCFIPGGSETTNPSELLANGRLKTLLDRIAPLFDWVILDSPPCLPVADASVLADHCDGVLFVVRAGLTPSSIVQKGAQELKGKNIVGVVLNTADEETLDHGSYYASSYYRNPDSKGPSK